MNTEKPMEANNKAQPTSSEESKSAKIIPFPANRIHRINTKEGFNEELAEHKLTYILSAIDDIMMAIIDKTAVKGFDPDYEKQEKDFSFLAESVKAMLYRSVGLNHPLHKFIDEHFEIVDDMESFTLLDEKALELFSPPETANTPGPIIA